MHFPSEPVPICDQHFRAKVSGCARTMTGAQHFCAIRSYIATTAKHGIKQLDALHQLAAGQPWLPTTT